MGTVDNQLAEELVRRGAPAATVEAAVRESAERDTSLMSALTGAGNISERLMAETAADLHGSVTWEQAGRPAEFTTTDLVPLSVARRMSAVPVADDGAAVTVAVADPGAIGALEELRIITGRSVTAVVATPSEMVDLLDRYARTTMGLNPEGATGVHLDDLQPDIDLASDDDAPVIQYVTGLLTRAVGAHSSDIHIEPGKHETRIRMRIDGVLHEIDTAPKAFQPAIISRLKIMAGLDIAERRRPQDGRFTLATADGRLVDLRIVTLPSVWGEKVNLRLLDSSQVELNLSSLGFGTRDRGRLSDAYTKTRGLVLITGPTGAGKSTTLYAALTEVNKPSVNIVTVEDPVEYRIEDITQVQISDKIGVTFESVLPHLLRSDPDILLVGEIRDELTARFAIQAAMTGHLTMSTLHTNDAPSAIVRLGELGVEPFLISSSVNVIVAQRLARRLCRSCSVEYTPGDIELDAAHWPSKLVDPPETLRRAVGCESCAGTGYRGRVAITELLTNSDEIQRLTVERAPASEITRAAIAEGMVPLIADGMDKCRRGLTTIDEVLRVTA